MAKGFARVFLPILLCFALCGCTMFSYQNINDMLRAPALGGGQDEIQKALVAYLDGAEPQYKYPMEGEWRSPLIRADLNADGRDEAVLLYSLADTSAAVRERGSFVCVAVLEYLSGAWQVVQDVQGLSTDVASVELANLLGTSSKQLIIGYATSNLNSKKIGLYTYGNQTLNKVYQADYSRYEISDFAGKGGMELVVVSREDEILTLRYVFGLNGNFVTDVEPVKLDANFNSCANIVPSSSKDGARLLVVDGVSNAENVLFSKIVYFSGEHFYTVDDSGAMRAATARQNTLLLSRDIDDDGKVEIPLSLGAIQTPKADKRLEFVRWMDFFVDTGQEAELRQFGLLDSERGVYIRLPSAWQSKLVVQDGENKGEWTLQNRDTKKTLISVRVLESGEAPPPNAALMPGSINSYLVFSAALTSLEAKFIEMYFLT